MSVYLGYALFVLLIVLWLRSQWREDDLFGKDADDSGYVDPARPHMVPPSAQVARPEDVHPMAGHADRLAAIGDAEESGYRTTSLRIVHGSTRVH